MFLKKLLRNKKGAVLIEYGLVIAGIALVTIAAVSILGSKTSDLVTSVATILPGVDPDDNGAIQSGKLIETTAGAVGTPISVDTAGILQNAGTSRLSENLGIQNGDLEDLVVKP